MTVDITPAQSTSDSRDPLLADVEAVLHAAPERTPEERFEAWTWRALLHRHGAQLWSRDCAPAHLTASAAVLDHDLTHCALVLHGRVHKWLQPGGHLEPGDTGAAAAAAREVAEETGLVAEVPPTLLRLSRHRAPCRPGVVDWHLDLQFLIVCARTPVQVSDESHDAGWWPLDALPEPLAPGITDLLHLARQQAGG